MKCPNCGCENFTRVALVGGDAYLTQKVEAYACDVCGRVELYMPVEWIGKNANAKRLAEEEKKFKENKEKRINELQKEIEDLQKIIVDENQTVKAVNEAKNRIVQTRNELEKAKTSYFPKKM